MSYEYDDMANDSDRGYEMSLDNAIYKKGENKMVTKKNVVKTKVRETLKAYSQIMVSLDWTLELLSKQNDTANYAAAKSLKDSLCLQYNKQLVDLMRAEQIQEITIYPTKNIKVKHSLLNKGAATTTADKD